MGRLPNLSTEKRAQVLAFTKAGWSTRKIAKEIKCNQSSVVRAKQRFSSTKGVKDRPRSGRPRALTIRDLRTIVHHVKQNRRLTSKEIQWDVRHHMKNDVGASTIRRLLFNYGLKGRVARKKPFVSQINRKKRLKFATEHRHWTTEQWSSVLWSDEKKFNKRGSDGRVYIRRSTTEEFLPCCTQGTVKGGGGSIMAWACFSAKGPGPLIKLVGNVDRHAYIDLLDTIVKPYMEEEVFQQDNAPIHKARDVTAYFEQNGMTVMEWPPQSPDLNPIENLWTCVDAAVKENKPKNLLELEVVVKEAWSDIPVAKCQKLIASMKTRCRDVIKNLGYPTKY